MYAWNAESIAFLKTASEYGDFPNVLARCAAAYIQKDANVLDAGCGLGYFSLALAPHVKSVTGADTSDDALAVLRENMKKRRVLNVTAYRGDVFALPPKMQFDAVTCCFFAGIFETLQLIKARCTGRAVLFQKDWDTHRFVLGAAPKRNHTYRAAMAELTARGIPFESEVFPVDMGQPFRSVSEAVRFFEIHDRSGGQKSITKDSVRVQLVPTGRADYPYYLPADRPVGLIALNAEDIPGNIEPLPISSMEELHK